MIGGARHTFDRPPEFVRRVMEEVGCSENSKKACWGDVMYRQGPSRWVPLAPIRAKLREELIAEHKAAVGKIATLDDEDESSGFEAEWEPSGAGETSADGCPESASTKTNHGRPSSGGGRDGGAEDSGLVQAAERGLGRDLPLRWMQKQKRSIPERAGTAATTFPQISLPAKPVAAGSGSKGASGPELNVFDPTHSSQQKDKEMHAPSDLRTTLILEDLPVDMTPEERWSYLDKIRQATEEEQEVLKEKMAIWHDARLS